MVGGDRRRRRRRTPMTSPKDLGGANTQSSASSSTTSTRTARTRGRRVRGSSREPSTTTTATTTGRTAATARSTSRATSGGSCSASAAATVKATARARTALDDLRRARRPDAPAVIELLAPRPHRASDLADAARREPAGDEPTPARAARGRARARGGRRDDDARVARLHARARGLRRRAAWLEDVESFWAEQLGLVRARTSRRRRARAGGCSEAPSRDRRDASRSDVAAPRDLVFFRVSPRRSTLGGAAASASVSARRA